MSDTPVADKTVTLPDSLVSQPASAPELQQLRAQIPRQQRMPSPQFQVVSYNDVNLTAAPYQVEVPLILARACLLDNHGSHPFLCEFDLSGGTFFRVFLDSHQLVPVQLPGAARRVLLTDLTQANLPSFGGTFSATGAVTGENPGTGFIALTSSDSPQAIEPVYRQIAGTQTAPMYVSQGALQAPNTLQTVAGDTVGVQRNNAVLYNGSGPMIVTTTGKAVIATVAVGPYDEVSVLYNVFALGTSTLNHIYIDEADSYGNVYHLYDSGAVAAGSYNIHLSKGIAASAITASVTGLSTNLLSSTTTTNIFLGVNFGSSLRFIYDFTKGDTNLTMYFSVEGK